MPDALKQRDCPKCRYPMLRAEKLGGVSDQIGVPNLEDTWVPPVLALLSARVLALGASALGLGLLSLLWMGLSRLLGGGAVGFGLGGLTLLLLELAALWKVSRWAGWQSLGAQWREQMDRRAGLGWFLMWVGLLLLTPRFLISLMLLEHAVSRTPPLTLLIYLFSALILTVGAVLVQSVIPLFISGGVGQASEARARRRQKLMRELSSHDWVCPNCLHAERERRP